MDVKHKKGYAVDNSAPAGAASAFDATLLFRYNQPSSRRGGILGVWGEASHSYTCVGRLSDAVAEDPTNASTGNYDQPVRTTTPALSWVPRWQRHGRGAPSTMALVQALLTPVKRLMPSILSTYTGDINEPIS